MRLLLIATLVVLSGCAEANRLTRDVADGVRTATDGARASGCAPGALFCDDFDAENNGAAELNYGALSNWTVTGGTVDLIGAGQYDFLPGNGLYVDLDGSTRRAGRLELRRPLRLEPGTYRVSFRLAGSQDRDDDNQVTVRLGDVFQETITVPSDRAFRAETRTVRVSAAQSAALSFQNAGGDNYGALLDVVRVERVR